MGFKLLCCSAPPQVLEHSHRPLHLRKGDFYSYLSLSSHDSDCGEVTQCSEDKSSTPTPYSVPSYAPPPQGPRSPSLETFTSTRRQAAAPKQALHPKTPEGPPLSPDVRDEETLFPACTEEVYLGPPLCYSVTLSKKPRRLLLEDSRSGWGPYFQATPPDPAGSPHPSPSGRRAPRGGAPVSADAAARRGEDPNLLCDVAESVSTPREERSRNEGPPYLNPRARVTLIDSSTAAECSPHTKALESNMGAVMTKISVCGSATNPSKEPAATATHINPKINCSPMREADTEEEQGAKRRDGGGRRRSVSQQEAAQTQVSVPGNSLIRYLRAAGISLSPQLL